MVKVSIGANHFNKQFIITLSTSIQLSLFFEVFFSFFRKLKQKKSPIYPDNKHLHMLSYYKISSYYGREKGNFINSIFINLVYLILITPGLYFIESPNLSRYWFFTLLVLYVITYSRLYRLTKN